VAVHTLNSIGDNTGIINAPSRQRVPTQRKCKKRDKLIIYLPDGQCLVRTTDLVDSVVVLNPGPAASLSDHGQEDLSNTDEDASDENLGNDNSARTVEENNSADLGCVEAPRTSSTLLIASTSTYGRGNSPGSILIQPSAINTLCCCSTLG